MEVKVIFRNLGDSEYWELPMDSFKEAISFRTAELEAGVGYCSQDFTIVII